MAVNSISFKSQAASSSPILVSAFANPAQGGITDSNGNSLPPTPQLVVVDNRISNDYLKDANSYMEFLKVYWPAVLAGLVVVIGGLGYSHWSLNKGLHNSEKAFGLERQQKKEHKVKVEAAARKYIQSLNEYKDIDELKINQMIDKLSYDLNQISYDTPDDQIESAVKTKLTDYSLQMALKRTERWF